MRRSRARSMGSTVNRTATERPMCGRHRARGRTRGDTMQLYDYQQVAVDSAARSLRRKRNPLIVSPTGTGKSMIGAALLKRTIGRRRALVVAHRDDLLGRWCDHLAAQGIRADIEQAERVASARAQVVVASVATISRESRRFDEGDFALVVLDEAHHAPAETWQRVARHYRCPRVGMTATPFRLDGKPLLGDLFDEVAYEMDLPTAIERGLVPPIYQRTVTVDAIDISRVRSRNGDLNAKDLGKVLTKVESLQGVAMPLVDMIGDRRTVAFAASVQHAEALAEQINGLRPGMARAISGDADRSHRDQILRDFEAGAFQVLCNCQLFTEGFDSPAISCVAMARPTESLALYTQAIGRALRLHPAKCDALVIDFCGNAGRHQLVSVVDLLIAKDDRAGTREFVAKGPVEGLPVHLALERARALPTDVIERYRTESVDPFGPREKLCEHCGTPFRKRRERARFCSHECFAAAKHWRPREDRRCGYCEALFSARGAAKYCSRQCYSRSLCRIPNRPCKSCGEPFRPKLARTMYCSLKCVGAENRLPEKACEHCGESFQPRVAKIKYCSRKCKGAASRLPEKACEHCGESFRPRSATTKYCSLKCKSAASRRPNRSSVRSGGGE